jgi:hypothetical protein
MRRFTLALAAAALCTPAQARTVTATGTMGWLHEEP